MINEELVVAETDKLKTRVADRFDASVTSTAKLYCPATVAFPETTPFAASVRPAGREPELAIRPQV